jgi:integrase
MDGRSLTFEDLTVHFIGQYDNYLRVELGNTTNTVHSNLKVIRRIINKGIDEELFSFEKNPFHRYKLKWDKPKKDFLTEDELRLIEALDIPEGSKLRLYRDMFVFSCYVGGLRISDLLFLERVEYDGERVLLNTEKTGEVVSILVMGKAKEIIDSYLKSSEGDFVFPCFNYTVDELSNAKLKFNVKSRCTARANSDLKKIALKTGVEKKLSTHAARHTYATRALRKGLRVEELQKIMGHASIKTTMQYAKIVNEDLDAAMRKFYSN